MDVAATYVAGDRFTIDVRGHRLVVDQPVTDGGGDAGPTPTELFVASLAACVGFYAERFLRRHGLPTDLLRVDCHASMSPDRPARVAAITLRMAGLPELSGRRREGLRAVVEHCTVHNSIRQAPRIEIELAA
jgi:putative redox protein